MIDQKLYGAFHVTVFCQKGLSIIGPALVKEG
jgi:hypothetical protein